ncbi:hypothetical protein IL306_013350 [Fusarium sp. DS 682]|nr:hypothetical protein IL306_013350 [Fusarium sp. DS 682]
MAATTKPQSVHHLDYATTLVAATANPFSEPWPGDNPTSSQRTKYVNAYLTWARQGDPALQAAVRKHASTRILGALLLVKVWTEAETEHLDYLVDEEYWHLWRESPCRSSSLPLTNNLVCTVEERDPKPVWPWTYLNPVFVPFSQSSRCLIHRPLRHSPRTADTPSGLPPCDNDKTEVASRENLYGGSLGPSSNGSAISRAYNWFASFGPWS